MTRARVAAVLLVLLHAAILFAGFLAPYPYAEQHRDLPYAPPVRLHWFDTGGRFHQRPFVYALNCRAGWCAEDRSRSVPVRFFVPAGTRADAGLLPLPVRLFGVNPPGAVFLLGSDAFGRDVLSRLLYGAQVSVFTGVFAAGLSLALGLAIGAAAGYYGGWVDQVLMRASELFMALPWVYLLLGVRAFLPLRLSPLQVSVLLVAIIGVLGWVRPARLVRGVVLSAREFGFVVAARHFGASDFYILRRHILPLTGGVVLTQATVLIPRYILAEVTLSFLGLGMGEPVPSWGNMLSEARHFHAVLTHTWMLAPGFAVVPVLLVYLFAADTLTAAAHARGDSLH